MSWKQSPLTWPTSAKTIQTSAEAVTSQVGTVMNGAVSRLTPLNSEATSVLEIEGDEAKAEEYRLQANALYLKIRDENPWPVNPETL